MSSSAPVLPMEALPAWCRLNNVHFNNVKLQYIEGKGLGLVATERWSLSADSDGAALDAPLLKVPRDLVLSSEAVDDFGKVDQNFRQLLDVMEYDSTRSKILIYLLAHLISSKPSNGARKGVVSTPWTEYIKFLPRDFSLPTLWSEAERALLQGTSLEDAVDAKNASLTHEFDELREKSSTLPFWNSLFWEPENVTVQDWALVDAWYRSRSLEVPSLGDSMVPTVDMANHSNQPDAYYDEDNEDNDCNVEILLRPGFTVERGDEVTISYGEFKAASELLFSYGFIDKNTSKGDMTLALDSFPDDPLAQAKVHVFGSFPTVRLSRTEGKVQWDSPYLHLMILNEEDGVDFRVLQDTDGGRQLRLFWQDVDVTDQAANFEALTEDHPLCPLFRLRAVTALGEQITSQLERIRSPLPEPTEADGSQMREACIHAAQMLKEIETSLLEETMSTLGEQQAHLLADEKVKAYLGSTEDAQKEQGPTATANEGDDEFS